MKLFEPPKNILEKIVAEKDDKTKDICNYLHHYEIYLRKNPMADEENIASFIVSIIPRIQEFYRNSLRKNKLWTNFPATLIGEAMKNCYNHGQKNKEIIFGLFLGSGGICYGFNDGGKYFRNKKIKHQWENKGKITKFDTKTIKSNFQCGVNGFMFPFSDYIHVDSKRGILYCVQMKENIINSETDQNKLVYNLRLEKSWE